MGVARLIDRSPRYAGPQRAVWEVDVIRAGRRQVAHPHAVALDFIRRDRLRGGIPPPRSRPQKRAGENASPWKVDQKRSVTMLKRTGPQTIVLSLSPLPAAGDTHQTQQAAAEQPDRCRDGDRLNIHCTRYIRIDWGTPTATLPHTVGHCDKGRERYRYGGISCGKDKRGNGSRPSDESKGANPQS